MPKKILIVDDEATITSRMSEIAAREGYHPLTASDGIEALEILKTDSVDMLLTDIAMPGMSGISLIALMTGYDLGGEKNAQKYFEGNLQKYNTFVESYKSIPLLMMSKDPSDTAAKIIGALGCFPKSWDENQPFDEKEFVEILRKYLPK